MFAFSTPYPGLDRGFKGLGAAPFQDAEAVGACPLMWCSPHVLDTLWKMQGAAPCRCLAGRVGGLRPHGI